MHAVTGVRLRLLWHPQPQFAGYLLAQHDKIAADYGIALTCQPVDFSQGPIDALLDGAADLAVASPAHMLQSRAPGELLLLLTIQQASSLVYGAHRDRIRGIADLAHRHIGVWPGGEDLELRWMLARAGLGSDAATLVPLGDTAQALAQGDVDAAQLTTYHEVFELEHHAGSLEAFVFLRAADVGAALLKDGLIATRSWVAADPRRAQRAVDAILAGWTRALDEPEHAVDLCASLRSDLTREHHARQFAEIRALATTGATGTHGLGFPDPAHLRAALDAVREVDGRAFGRDAEAFIEPRFWRAAPPANRRTAW